MPDVRGRKKEDNRLWWTLRAMNLTNISSLARKMGLPVETFNALVKYKIMPQFDTAEIVFTCIHEEIAKRPDEAFPFIPAKVTRLWLWGDRPGRLSDGKKGRWPR